MQMQIKKNIFGNFGEEQLVNAHQRRPVLQT